MRRLMLALCGLQFCLGLFPVRAGELPSVLVMKDLGWTSVNFQGQDCTITKVEVSDENISVSFNGRWVPSKDPSPHENLVIYIGRRPNASLRAFEALGRRFSKYLGQRVNIAINTGGSYAIFGGQPDLTFPDDQFDITPVDTSSTSPAVISKTASILPESVSYHGGTFYSGRSRYAP